MSYRNFQMILGTLRIQSFSDTWIIPSQEQVEVIELAKISKRVTGQLGHVEIVGKVRQLITEKKVSLVHDNGVWQPINIYVTIATKQAKVPLVVSPRGMLEPWAIQNKWLQKKVMWFVYQKYLLEKADVLHATSFSEAQNLRSLGLTQPIAVLPNAVDFPEGVDANASDVGNTPKRTLLFMSRIHPKKGLLTLVEAAKHVDLTNWNVLIVGPDENDHISEVKAAVQQAGLQEVFSFMSAVEDGEKWTIYQQADLFVLPSFSENFGIVVAEALVAGVPVITTKGCPWEDLDTYNCGWWIDIGVEPLIAALRTAMTLDQDKLDQMGQNGIRLIAEKYGWSSVADQMASVYRWMLKQGPQPSCIV